MQNNSDIIVRTRDFYVEFRGFTTHSGALDLNPFVLNLKRGTLYCVISVCWLSYSTGDDIDHLCYSEFPIISSQVWSRVGWRYLWIGLKFSIGCRLGLVVTNRSSGRDQELAIYRNLCHVAVVPRILRMSTKRFTATRLLAHWAKRHVVGYEMQHNMIFLHNSWAGSTF